MKCPACDGTGRMTMRMVGAKQGLGIRKAVWYLIMVHGAMPCVCCKGRRRL